MSPCVLVRQVSCSAGGGFRTLATQPAAEMLSPRPLALQPLPAHLTHLETVVGSNSHRSAYFPEQAGLPGMQGVLWGQLPWPGRDHGLHSDGSTAVNVGTKDGQGVLRQPPPGSRFPWKHSPRRSEGLEN